MRARTTLPMLTPKPLILATLLLTGAAFAQAPSSPAEPPSYEPLPLAWNIPLNIPGVLSVGARYCTQQGKCRTVGEELGVISLPGGGSAPAEIACRESPELAVCVQGRVPVQLLARSPAGSVIARLNGRNYGITGLQWALERPDGSAIGGPIMIEAQGELAPLHYELNGMTKAWRLAHHKALELRRTNAIASVLKTRRKRCDELLSVLKASEGGEYTATCLVKGKQVVYREYVSGLE